MAEKSTLINCNLVEMNIGKSHVTWSSVGSNTADVKRGITKIHTYKHNTYNKLRYQHVLNGTLY